MKSKIQLYKVLIVEDEQMMCDYYEMMFQDLQEAHANLRFTSSSYTTYETAYLAITSKMKRFDLVLLDLRLTDRDRQITKDGAELGVLLRREMPKAKIIIFTGVPSHRKFDRIFQKINPEGFWVKDEIKNPDEVKIGILEVLENKNFYSPMVSKFLKDQAIGNIVLDQIDRDILYYLSKGIKTKNLPKYLPLSQSGIERRKRNLFKFFNLDSTDEAELIRIAKSKGII